MSVVIQEIPLAFGGGGIEILRDDAAEQLAMRGKRYDPTEFTSVVACQHMGVQINAAYEQKPLFESSAMSSYDAWLAENDDQFRRLIDLGFTVTVVDEDPYRDIKQMFADLDIGRLLVFSTAACGNPHPLVSDADNDKFRAVHDAFGHGGTGRGFDIHGEEAAWLLHHRMYSPRAQPALTTETRGQNCAMVFGNPPGVFKRQKAVLLPELFDDESTVHVAPCGGRCVP